MRRRFTYQNIVFVTMVFSVLVSIVSIISLARAQSAAEPIQQPQHLRISGTYFTSDNPTSCPLPANGDLDLPNEKITVTVTGKFNRNIPSGEIISLRLDNLHFRMFIDDTLFYESGSPFSTLPYVRSSGNGWQYVISPGITTDQEIGIEMTSIYSNHANANFKVFFDELYSGNPALHISRDLRASLFQGMMAIFIFIMGILELGYAMALSYRRNNANDYYTLAGMSIFCGIWLYLDFNTLELFIPFPIMNNALQYLSLSLLMCYGLLHTTTQLTGRRKNFIRIIAACAIALTLYSVFCQHFGALDYHDLARPMYLSLGLASIAMLVALFFEYKVRSDTAQRRKLYPLFALFICSTVATAVSYLFFRWHPFLMFGVAYSIFTLCQLYVVLRAATDAAVSKANIRLLQEDKERQERLLEYQALLSQSTKGLYDSIYELDITHNRAAGESTEKYFESLGISKDTPYDQAVEFIAQAQIHPDYRQGYINLFRCAHVLEQYRTGIDSLQYDFLISLNGEDYFWMRIDARIFFWNDDQSVRMIVYRQNVDDEKRQELDLLNRASQDSLTGLLNREAIEHKTQELLETKSALCGAYCMILDLDDFKTINDTFGHMAGDFVLKQFSTLLCEKFPPPAFVGRLGGDEFIILAPCQELDTIKAHTKAFLMDISSTHLQFEGKALPLFVSAGVAFLSSGDTTFQQLYRHADAALYQSKRDGKKRYTICEMTTSQAQISFFT